MKENAQKCNGGKSANPEFPLCVCEKRYSDHRDKRIKWQCHLGTNLRYQLRPSAPKAKSKNEAKGYAPVLDASSQIPSRKHSSYFV